MTPDQLYALAKLRMAETEALAQYARMTADRRPAPLWPAVWRRLRRAGDRPAPERAAQRPRPVAGP